MSFFFLKFFYILNIIFIIYSKPIGTYPIIDFHQMIIKYDFYNIKDKQLIALLNTNFKSVCNYFKEIFYTKESPKRNKYYSHIFTNVKCQNEKKYRIFSSIVLDKCDLLLLPIINDNDNNNPTNVNNGVYLEGEICKMEDNKPYIILIKISPLIIELNKELNQIIFDNYIKWSLIKILLHALGFNKDALKYYHIENNYKILPHYYMKKFNYYNSVMKYYKLISYKREKIDISESNIINSYSNNLPRLPLLNDIMNDKISVDTSLTSCISEITLNIFNEFYHYKTTKCDVEYFVNKCYRANQKCMNKKKLEKFFIEYSFNNNKRNMNKSLEDDEFFKNDKIICYLNSEKNIKNKQCGINYGHLLSNEDLNNKICANYWLQNVNNIKYNISEINNNINNTISELELYKNQIINLLLPSPLCPNKNLKTIFFENSGRNKNESIDIEKIGITDPKFYVCYSKSIPTESISDIMSKNNLIQSYQIWGDHNLHFSNKGIKLQKIPNNIKFNEYQKINFYPESNINKDELYIFYLNLNKKFPSEYNYMPEAFINPKDSKKIKEIFEDYNFDIKNLWIFQRAVNEDGGGAKFFRGYYQIENARTKNSSFLIKKYINNPFLINNKKFNIKAYALVTGLNPLRIYLYNDGLLLFNNYEFNLNKDLLIVYIF